MIKTKQNIASHWFRASEASGDFMGIRYGRVPQGSDEVEWMFVSHCDCDGIGGFARLLRERGASFEKLPQTKTTCRGVIAPLWRLLCEKRDHKQCANRNDWLKTDLHETESTPAVAWHLFTRDETADIIRKCREQKVTVNSLLLKCLDQVIRTEILRPQLKLPWMIPVNLRGDVNHDDDTENHVSCVEVAIAPNDSAETIQQKILQRLHRGEHRANHLLLSLGKLLSHDLKVALLKKDRSKSAGNIGAFSNLGVWDPDKKIDTNDCWLFCPPVVRGQLLGAGCVTFQNRLGLTIQSPGLRSSHNFTKLGMQGWVDAIKAEKAIK